MLTTTIEKYQKLFAEASASRNTTLTLRLVEEMKQEFRANPPPVGEVIHGLELIANHGRPPSAEFILSAAWGNLSADYTPALCRILDNPECNAVHEAAVELLQEVGDEQAVPALMKAISYRWGYDQWLQVPRKSLQALAAIGSSEAIDIVKAALNSTEKAIREEAASILEDE